MITLLSYGGISDRLLGPLEKVYPPYNFESSNNVPSGKGDIRYVVVLGGGHTSDPGLPATSRINESTLNRLVEAIRIYRKNPGSKLLLSGSGIYDPVSNAEIMADVALLLGVDERDIILESVSMDTKAEADIISSIIGEDPFVLVTSASHMPRSLLMFQKLKMRPIPAPTGHRVKKRQGDMSPGVFFPSAGNLEKSEMAFHEYIGIAWAKIRGYI